MDRQKIERAGTFILGGVAGAVFGILISPRSGREVRGSMSSRAGEARDRSRESYFEARERARERLAAMREAGPRGGEDATDNAEGIIIGEPMPEAAEEATGAGPSGWEGQPGHPSLRSVPPEKSEEAGDGTVDHGNREDPDPSEASEALRRRISKTRERLRGGGQNG